MHISHILSRKYILGSEVTIYTLESMHCQT